MSLLNRDADGGLKAANALKAANRLSYARLWLKIPASRRLGAARPILRLNARTAPRRAAWPSPAFRKPGRSWP